MMSGSEIREIPVPVGMRILRTVGHLLPPVPYVTGVFNRLLRPLLFRSMRGYVRTRVKDIVMDLDPNECVDSSLYFYPHLYDREELAFLIARLRGGGVFLDVGAHIGWYSLAIAKEVPAVRVIAVEADPFNGKRLREHVALNSMENRVTIVPCGVSDKDEVLRLNLQLRGNRGGNSFVFEHQASVDVRCLPLAAILSDLQIDEIAAMKMDIEGFEFRVLNRFLNDVPRSVWPRSVVIEYFAEQANTGDTIRLLTSHGYRVVRRTRMNWLLELPGTDVAVKALLDTRLQ